MVIISEGQIPSFGTFRFFFLVSYLWEAHYLSLFRQLWSRWCISIHKWRSLDHKKWCCHSNIHGWAFIVQRVKRYAIVCQGLFAVNGKPVPILGTTIKAALAKFCYSISIWKICLLKLPRDKSMLFCVSIIQKRTSLKKSDLKDFVKKSCNLLFFQCAKV